MARPLRILHCPTSTGGNAHGLARGERALGLESDVAYIDDNPFRYPSDVEARSDHPWAAVRLSRRLLFLGRAIRRYDVFHFNFGTPLLSVWRLRAFGLDLPIYRRLGKKVVVTYNGCDARLRHRCFGANLVSDDSMCACGSSEDDRSKLHRLAKMRRYADHTFALNPDLVPMLPGSEFLPYTNVDIRALTPERARRRRGQLRIVHAPSNPLVKGTSFVVQAARRLEREFEALEFVTLEHRPNAEVIDGLGDADIVIDQLHAGWYGGLAVEAMALGKPVICFIRQSDLRFIPEAMRHDVLETILHATTDNVYEVLRQVILDPTQLPALGERARAYVERWHDPVKVAGRVREVYES